MPSAAKAQSIQGAWDEKDSQTRTGNQEKQHRSILRPQGERVLLPRHKTPSVNTRLKPTVQVSTSSLRSTD